MNFEILALDTFGKSNIGSEVDLLHLFRSYGELWENPSLDEEKLTITDGDYTLEVQKVKSDVKTYKTFLIKVAGDYDWLEPKRINILNFLYDQKLNDLYVFLDEVSEQISTELYPLIYQLENALRSYLNKFMITKVGLSWWKITATSELSKKVNERKNNEKEFSQFIDNKLYLADFGDLGQLIYKHSSGFITKEDILNKIDEVEETPEAIRKLKNDLKSNYQKFFREHFKNNGFQDKWQEMEKLRNKVAHNNLFTNSDLERGQMLCNQLMNIIDTARQEVDNVILQQEEKEEIAESIEKDVLERNKRALDSSLELLESLNLPNQTIISDSLSKLAESQLELLESLNLPNQTIISDSLSKQLEITSKLFSKTGGLDSLSKVLANSINFPIQTGVLDSLSEQLEITRKLLSRSVRLDSLSEQLKKSEYMSNYEREEE